MGFATYADVLRNPIARRILLLGMGVRAPMFAWNVAITLHVVTSLHRSYADAGIVAAVEAVTLGISGPWRGRLLDKYGIRRSTAPSIIVQFVVWSVTPWMGFWWLVVGAGVAGLFTVPSFSIVRAVLIGAVGSDQRTTALSVDAIAAELTFMVGPVLGVLAATTMPTALAVFICGMATTVAEALIWWDNPPMNGQHEPAAPSRTRLRATLPIIAVLGMSAASVLILTGEDMSTVAAMRSWNDPSAIGWVLALWGAGSAIGGLVYGALRKHPPAGVLLLLLGSSTVLVAVANDLWSFVVLITLSGAFCAPTMTAVTEAMSRIVPQGNRGEALSWQGSAMMLGSAAGSPLIGIGIDRGGWEWGLLVAGGCGLLLAFLGVLATRRAQAYDMVGVEVEPEPLSV